MNTSSQSLFEQFDKRPKTYLALIMLIYMAINNTILATSVWMEATRNGNQPSFQMWEPFVWEYSSAIATLVMLPFVFYWFSRFPLSFSKPAKQVAGHFLASVFFSAVHVVLMVGLRELVYSFSSSEYNFGNWLREFFYEYRKDLWSYMFWMLLYYGYRFVYSRLKGEASLLDDQEDAVQKITPPVPEHFLVKKLDKEYLVNVDDIEWLESAGNYVNLHSKGRIYPLRATMNGLLPRLEEKGFSRIHRSFGVNLAEVDSIETLPSGDAEVLLKSGKTLALSRRFKDEFRQKVS